MCGFVGIWNSSEFKEINNEHLKSMLCAIHHRGPDDFGFWNEDVRMMTQNGKENGRFAPSDGKIFRLRRGKGASGGACGEHE